LGAGIAYAEFHGSTRDPASQTSKADGTGNSDINFNPPTKTDQNETDQTKENIVKQQTSPGSTSNTGKITVNPNITYADKTTINGYVTGVFEEGGTCTATLTQGSQTITRTSIGFGNASYTQCPPISLTDAKLSAGTWTVILSYDSAKAAGSSQPKTFNVR
jgi:hypothetical protein